MIDKLKQIENKLLLELLSKPNDWKSVFFNLSAPITEICWIQVGNYKIFVCFIHKYEEKDIKPNPNQSPHSIHVLNGKYELGFNSKQYLIMIDGGDTYYEINNNEGQNFIRPIEGVCATVSLTGLQQDIGEGQPLDYGRKMLMLEWFSNYYKSRGQNERSIENEKINKGDWVVVDDKLMNDGERRGVEKYFGQKGFVIKKEGSFVDIRFGNDRIQLNVKNLILLNPADKPKEKTTEKTTEKTENKIDKNDYMDPNNWD